MPYLSSPRREREASSPHCTSTSTREVVRVLHTVSYKLFKYSKTYIQVLVLKNKITISTLFGWGSTRYEYGGPSVARGYVSEHSERERPTGAGLIDNTNTEKGIVPIPIIM